MGTLGVANPSDAVPQNMVDPSADSIRVRAVEMGTAYLPCGYYR